RLRTEKEEAGTRVEGFPYDEKKLAELAYIIFFFGIGEISNKGIDYYKGGFNSDLIQEIIRKLEIIQKRYIKKSRNKEWVKLKTRIDNTQISLEVNFEPFDGHVAKLGHYFRHLYQLIKLATTDPVLNQEDREDEKK